jgi:hypothetical protein
MSLYLLVMGSVSQDLMRVPLHVSPAIEQCIVEILI